MEILLNEPDSAYEVCQPQKRGVPRLDNDDHPTWRDYATHFGQGDSDVLLCQQVVKSSLNYSDVPRG